MCFWAEAVFLKSLILIHANRSRDVVCYASPLGHLSDMNQTRRDFLLKHPVNGPVFIAETWRLCARSSQKLLDPKWSRTMCRSYRDWGLVGLMASERLL